MSTPTPAPANEPLATLHAQVRRYASELAERDAVIASHEASIAERDAMIEHLQEQVRLLLAQRFAPSSEKMPDGQLGLFNEAEASAAEHEPSESEPGTEVGGPSAWEPEACAVARVPAARRHRASAGGIATHLPAAWGGARALR